MKNDLQEGRLLLDKYELREIIGQGGTGSVFKAYDRHLEQDVAVKQIVRAEQDGVKADSLWNEVEVLKRLEHQALPHICDYFREGENDYLVLEYIQGVTLEQYIYENGPMEQQQAIAFMKALLSVFGYLHALSPPIIYRDLKPSNIMLRNDGQIKLIDFGTALACFCGKEMSYIKAGTPGFGAPELFDPKKSFKDCRESSDIYSLGAVFHYILTGMNPPWMLSHRRPVREYNKAISDGIEKIILKCMQENIQKRYHYVSQLQQDLEYYKRLETKRIIIEKTVRGIYLFLLAAGIIMVLLEAGQGIPLPLLWREGKWEWDPGYEISDKLLSGFILLFAGSCGKIVAVVKNRKRWNRQKQEKNLLLTEKKTIGLWGLNLFIVFMLGAILYRGETAYAEERIQEQLPVIVRDSGGHKLLIQEDAVYRPSKDIILELPLSGIPAGEEVIVQVMVSGQEKRLESRKFLVMIAE